MNNSDIDNLARLVVEQVNKGGFNTPKLVKGQAADNIDLEEPEEYEGATVEDGKPTKAKEPVLKKENNSMLKNSFDSLFKNTIVEQDEMVDDTDTFGDEGSAGAEDFEGSEGETTEEVDVVTRLQMIINDLQNVVDELGGETPEEQEHEGSEEEEYEGSEEGPEEGSEFGSEEEEEPVGEAVSEPEPKALSDAGGKKLMGKGSIKVGGRIKASGGTASSGTIKNAPELASMSDAGGRGLMGKGAMKVSSKVAAGKDLFNV